jgi:hypothetical protein
MTAAVRCVLVISMCVALADVSAVAQGRQPAKTTDPEAPLSHKGPAHRVALQNGRLKECQGEQCLKVKLDDLGSDRGLYFARIREAGAKLSGVWCTCDLRDCRRPEAWEDDNPVTGSSPVKVNERPNVIAQLRRFDNRVWAIQWHSPGAMNASGWTSDYVFVSSAPLTDRVFTDRSVVIRCDPIKSSHE